MPPQPVTTQDYASFLPAARQTSLVTGESDWWRWGGHHVHLMRYQDPQAPVRLVVVHGAGAHAAALWPLASMAARIGLDVTAVDLPLYGATRVRDRGLVTYGDWVELLSAFLEAHHDGRPLAVLGGSIGGLLAVEAAARAGNVSAVIATCLLDPLTQDGRACMTRFGRWALPFMKLLPLVRGPIARIPVKISWTAKLSAMGRDPRLGRLCARDPRGGGAWVPLGFLASYLLHDYAAARNKPVPVHLTHPELDDWTPMELSVRTLAALPGPTSTTVLSRCGHFPLEEPGLAQLQGVIEQVCRSAQ